MMILVENSFPMLAASNKDGRRIRNVEDAEDSRVRRIERRRNRAAEKNELSREVSEIINRVESPC